MKRTLILGVGALIVMAAVSASAQTRSAGPQGNSAQATAGPRFVDNDGDGICDLYQAGTRQGRVGSARGGNGPADGTGNRGIGPRDGSGFGRGPASGGAACDGTGPKGRGRGARN
jgi:hypothetical protein